MAVATARKSVTRKDVEVPMVLTKSELQTIVGLAVAEALAKSQVTPKAKATAKPKAVAKPKAKAKEPATDEQKAEYARLWKQRVDRRKDLKIVATAGVSAWAMDARSKDPRMVKIVTKMTNLSKSVAWGTLTAK